MQELKPIWKYKVRTNRGKLGTERLIRIPPEIANQLGEYVKITISDGKLVIEPYSYDEAPVSNLGGEKS